MFTPEQIQAYWDANPGALEQSVAANPGMFGLGGQDINVGISGAGTERAPAAPSSDFIGQFGGTTRQAQTKPGLLSSQQTSSVTDAEQSGGGAFQNFVQEAFSQSQDNMVNAPLIRRSDPNFVSVHEQRRNESSRHHDAMLARAAEEDVPLFIQEDDKVRLLNTGGGWTQYGTAQATAEELGLPTDDIEWTFSNEENGQPGDYSIILEPKVEDNLASNIFGTVLTTGLGIAGGPAGAALGGALTSATQGGDFEDALTSAAVSGLTSYVGDGLFEGMTDSAVRSALEGGTVELVNQGFEGEFDLEDVLTAAGISGATTAVTDSIDDYIDGSKYTDEFLEEQIEQGLISGDVIDGVITGGRAEELADLYNSTDFGALFGENGFLNQTFGVGGERISTEFFDTALQSLDPAISFLLDNPVGESIANSPVTGMLLDGVSHLMGVETPTKEEVKEFMQNNYNLNPNNPDYDRERARLDSDIKESGFDYGPNEFLTDDEQYNEILTLGDDPYHEEFFESNAERSEDSTVTGTHVENPFTNSSSSTSPTTTPSTSTSTNTGSSPEEPLPEQETSIAQSVFDTIQDLLNNRGKMTDEDLEVDTDLTEGTVPGDPDEGELTLGDGGYPSDTELPSPDTEDTELPSSGTDEDELTLGDGGYPEDTELPTGDSETTLPDDDSTGTIEDELPTTTGGGGGGTLPGDPPGMMGGDGDFKAFMSGINYVLPVLKQMGIPFEDFMKMWTSKNG